MTTFAIVKLVLLLAGMLGAGGGIFYIKHRLKKGDQAIENEDVLKNQKLKTSKVENKKKKIREDHDETENDIINNPGGDHGVMPKSTRRKHNHARRDTCGKDCPAYSGN